MAQEETTAGVKPRRGRRRFRKWRPGEGVDETKTVKWVLDHLDGGDRGAPSPGALSMLDWARENRDTFFRVYMPKLIPATTGRPFGRKTRGEKEVDPALTFLKERIKRRKEEAAARRNHGGQKAREEPDCGSPYRTAGKIGEEHGDTAAEDFHGGMGTGSAPDGGAVLADDIGGTAFVPETVSDDATNGNLTGASLMRLFAAKLPAI